jgi:hypothetical protein
MAHRWTTFQTFFYSFTISFIFYPALKKKHFIRDTPVVRSIQVIKKDERLWLVCD